jgi:hypothetical protein
MKTTQKTSTSIVKNIFRLLFIQHLPCFTAAQPIPVAIAPNPNYQVDSVMLANLQPGEWYEIQNSPLNALNPCPAHNCEYTAVSGLISIMRAWSGGAYDWVNEKLIIHGGGHTDYAGNEIYAFDLQYLQWERLINPSTNIHANELWFPDSTPNSSHTYDNVEYVPQINCFCVFGNGSRWSNGFSGPSVACFDMNSYTWIHKADIPSPGSAIGGKSAYDPVSQSVWRHGAANMGFMQYYDPQQDTFVNHGYQGYEPTGWISYQSTGEIDPLRRLFITVGGGEVMAWDLTANPSPGIIMPTTGDSTMVTAGNPGLVYDPIGKKLVAWHGGENVYVLDTSWHWTKILPASSNTIIPGSSALNGTYGRFRYIASQNLYIAVNKYNENVYFYRLYADTTSTTSTIEFKDEQPAKVFPNPSNQKTTIEFKNPKNENCTLTLYDSQGRFARTVTNITTGKVEIERQNLTSGLYFFQLHTESQIIAAGKFIIE